MKQLMNVLMLKLKIVIWVIKIISKINMEKDKILKPNCPSCNGTNIIKKEIRDDNGIIGPGYESWVVDSWYSCKDCGTRFDVVDEIK